MKKRKKMGKTTKRSGEVGNPFFPCKVNNENAVIDI
jgi:hypothetical protein